MVNQFVCLMYEEEGASSIEYAMLASFIAAVIVGSVAILGGKVTSLYTTVSTALS